MANHLETITPNAASLYREISFVGRYDKIKQPPTTQQEPEGASPFIKTGKLTNTCRRSGYLYAFRL